MSKCCSLAGKSKKDFSMFYFLFQTPNHTLEILATFAQGSVVAGEVEEVRQVVVLVVVLEVELALVEPKVVELAELQGVVREVMEAVELEVVLLVGWKEWERVVEVALELMEWVAEEQLLVAALEGVQLVELEVLPV